MKVLVCFEHQFIGKGIGNLAPIKITETISHVFEAKSDEDLLDQFEQWNLVPPYIQQLNKRRIFTSGKKQMLWYLPESNNQIIEDTKCVA